MPRKKNCALCRDGITHRHDQIEQRWLSDPRYYLLIDPDPPFPEVVLWDGQERKIIDRKEYAGSEPHQYLEWAEALYLLRRLPRGPYG